MASSFRSRWRQHRRGHVRGDHRTNAVRLFSDAGIMSADCYLARSVETNAMPVHDWTRVDAGIFHHFHHGWIEEIARGLNRGILPADYYALAEQHAAGFGPAVLTLQGGRNGEACA